VKRNERDGGLEFTTIIGLGGKLAIIESQTKENFENGEDYVRLIETPYQNLMLNNQVLITEEKLARHMLFLPQEVL
jgi:hypothetical protein